MFLTLYHIMIQEGLADCIANEDGERQIACAVSFHGEETVSNVNLLSREAFTLIQASSSILETKQSHSW